MSHAILFPPSSSLCSIGARRARCATALRRHGLPMRPCARPPQAATTGARQAVGTKAEEEYVEEDFYALLGVSPLADTKEIKRAYYSMMRTCHPDRSVDFEATEFCALLNDVYETLSDPVKRALYDELAGFSADSLNPFLDDRFPADRVFVDEFSCIGCRNCNNVCPKTFTMEEEYGRARVMVQDADTEAKLQEAIDTCPVSCIHWVTGPQLSLLESAMARMERIAVWSMMGGAGANRDVFTEASLAWTKRQAEIRRRVDAAVARASMDSYDMDEQPAPKKTGWSFWGMGAGFGAATGSTFYNQADKAQKAKQAKQQASSSNGANGNGNGEGNGGAFAGDRETRSVAALAARAARAARTWKRYQEVTQAARRERMVLSSTSSASSLDSMDMP